MNYLRNVKVKYITNIKPISDVAIATPKKKTKKVVEQKPVKVKRKVKKFKKLSERAEFKVDFSNYVRYNLAYFTGKDYIEYLDKKNTKYNIIKNNNKPIIKVKNPYDKLRVYSCYEILSDVDNNFYKLSKSIRKFYKSQGYKLHKIDSDEIILNKTNEYLKDMTREEIARNSVMNMYVIYNFMMKKANHDYLNDFHVYIDEEMNELRYRYSVKPDLKVPNYLYKKKGKGLEKIFKLSYMLVTTSDKIEYKLPSKKYLQKSSTRKDYIKAYKMLGKGIKKYMKNGCISPLFIIYLNALQDTDIMSKLGYGDVKNQNVLLGISSILFTYILMNTEGIHKGIRNMIDSPRGNTHEPAILVNLVNNFMKRFNT